MEWCQAQAYVSGVSSEYYRSGDGRGTCLYDDHHALIDCVQKMEVSRDVCLPDLV